MEKELDELNQSVIKCNQCLRLRAHCQLIAHEKRKAFSNEEYWGKPVPAFGDPNAELILIGLAPAAHGANRTGRMFTGDRSGEWLYRALHKAGFSSAPQSLSIQDGLYLNNAYITATVRCAPPQNKPTPEEISHCSHFLKKELELLRNARVYLALGKLAYDSVWRLFKQNFFYLPPKPPFQHGACTPIYSRLKKKSWILSSYHPSQQNTFTGVLTEPMFDEIFSAARRLLQSKDQEEKGLLSKKNL